jgi:gas vesicle protein
MSNGNNNMSGKDFVIGALLGGIIGAGTALLLAPKSGRELRENINDGYQLASKKTSELAKNVGDQTDVLVGKVKEVAEYVKEDVQKWKRNGENAVGEVKEEVEEAIVKDEVAATIEEVTEAVDNKVKSK